MASIFLSGPGERAQYKQAYDLLSKTPGVSATALENAILTQSFLRSIIPLNATATSFTWQILSNQNNTGTTIRPDEVRLNQQDAVFVSKIWVYIFSSSGYAYAPQTYPNAQTFPTGAAGLYSFYNGNLSINVNNSVIVPNYAMTKFLQIPQTQLTAATNSPVTQFDGTLLLPWEPNVVFGGTYQTTVSVSLPQSIGTIDANTYAALYVEGIRAQNVCLGASN